MIHTFLVSLVLLAPTADPGPRSPNIVILYADDLGYGDLSCYGATAVATPNADRLAREGRRFTDAHCVAPTCTPSRFALLTGRYPFRRDGVVVLRGDAPLLVEPGSATLPAVMARAGYRSAVVGKWHLGLGAGAIDWNGSITPGPREVGFHESFIMAATGDRVPCVYLRGDRVVGLDPADPLRVDYTKKIGDEPTGRENPELLKLGLNLGHDGTIVNGVSRIGWMSGGTAARWNDEEMADTYVREAVGFLERHRVEHAAEPFLLYFATHSIHVPRIVNPRFRGATKMGARGDAIVEFDFQVGAILDALDRLELAANTIVILSSDNGPVFDDGYADGAGPLGGEHSAAGPWNGGKYSFHEGGTRVPTLVRWPGHVEPGESAALVSQVDLVATLAALTGVALAAQEASDSLDQRAAWFGTDTAGRSRLITAGGGFGLRQGSWKLVRMDKRGGFVRETLYDLATDPTEQVDVAAQHLDVRARLAGELDSVIAAKGERGQ